MKLDLHGYTVHDAWKYFRQQTKIYYLNGIRRIVVVTGHGAMSTEIERWCEADPYVVECQRLDPNTGAWSVTLKRRSKAQQKIEPPKSMVDFSKLIQKFSK